MFHAIILVRLIRIFTKFPILISTSHCINEMNKYSMFLYRITDFLTTISTNVSKNALVEYVDKKAWPKRKSLVIENGININSFNFSIKKRNEIRNSLHLNSNTKLILTVGRLVEEKNYPFLLNTFSKISYPNDQVKLLIIGDGPILNKLKDLAVELKINSKVIFLGKKLNISEWMSACDLFVLCSKFEGFGLVVAEAMACKRVVISSDCGATKEIINKYGFVFDVNNESMFINLIEKCLIMDNSQLELLGEKARNFVLKNFSINETARKWEQLYLKLI